jgi:hypothetical protein
LQAILGARLMSGSSGISRFIVRNALVWFAMTIILVIVPDALERWLGLAPARVIGWALACCIWVVTVEQHWKARYGVFTRFVAQFVLWVSSALIAIYISDLFRT